MANPVGTGVGAGVGAGVGTRDGGSVGNSVASSVGWRRRCGIWPVENVVGDFGEPVGDAVGDCVGTLVGDPVRGYVSASVDDRTAGRLWRASRMGGVDAASASNPIITIMNPVTIIVMSENSHFDTQ